MQTKWNVLIIGNGIKESVIASKIQKSPLLDTLFCIPKHESVGAPLSESLDIENYHSIANWMQLHHIQFVIIPDSKYLENGLVSYLQSKNIATIWCPGSEDTKLATSREACYEFLHRYGITTPMTRFFDNMESAVAYTEKTGFPIVAKTDGMLLSKTLVFKSKKMDELEEFLTYTMKEGRYGEAGSKVLLQRFVPGDPIVVSLVVESRKILILPYCFPFDSSISLPFMKGGYIPSLDTKKGSKARYLSQKHFQKVHQNLERTVIVPLVHALNERIPNYRGIVTLCVVMSEKGLYVVDFRIGWNNLTAVMLFSRLSSDLLELLLTIARDDIEKLNLSWESIATLGFVLETRLNETHDIQKFYSMHNHQNTSSFSIYKGGNEISQIGMSLHGETLKAAFDILSQKWKEANLTQDSLVLKNLGTLVNIVEQ